MNRPLPDRERNAVKRLNAQEAAMRAKSDDLQSSMSVVVAAAAAGDFSHRIDKDYQDFLNIQDTQLPAVIMASPEEFDAKWDAFVEAINPSCEVYSNFMHEEVLKLVAAYYGE